MRRMTPGACREFLMAGTRTGKLATVRADGRPHLTPVWFVVDGDDLVFNAGEDTVKARNLRRDHRLTLVVDDDQFPYAYVVVEGTATLSDDLAQVRRWATIIAERYVPAGQADAYGARNGVPGELLVRVNVTRTVGYDGIAD